VYCKKYQCFPEMLLEMEQSPHQSQPDRRRLTKRVTFVKIDCPSEYQFSKLEKAGLKTISPNGRKSKTLTVNSLISSKGGGETWNEDGRSSKKKGGRLLRKS